MASISGVGVADDVVGVEPPRELGVEVGAPPRRFVREGLAQGRQDRGDAGRRASGRAGVVVVAGDDQGPLVVVDAVDLVGVDDVLQPQAVLAGDAPGDRLGGVRVAVLGPVDDRPRVVGAHGPDDAVGAVGPCVCGHGGHGPPGPDRTGACHQPKGFLGGSLRLAASGNRPDGSRSGRLSGRYTQCGARPR